MTNNTHCASADCEKRFACDRHVTPATAEEAMQKYEKHHPEAPWLCFYPQKKEKK